MNAKIFGVLSVYGLLIALGVLLAVILCNYECKRRAMPRDIAIDMALWALPPGVLGARAYYVAFRWELYAPDPLSALRFWEGGLAIYGAVLGGILGLFLLSRRRRVKLAALMGVVAPVLILAQGIGRWGNFFNGEAYGALVTNARWQFFPAAVYAGGAWHLATFFYESVWDIAGFFLLWFTRKRARFDGHVFVRYLLWYGAGRLFIEGLRADSLMLFSMRVSQLLSLLLCVMALLALARRARSGRARVYLAAAGGAALAALGFVLSSPWLALLASALFLLSGFGAEKQAET